jgi:alpha-beta hydrolase superfamily lysophospholipase
MKQAPRMPEDFIVPLNINGLDGRMLHVPSQNRRKREILLIYGHHAMLERWWGLVENLSQYGTVTMPDMPGFGGMESFSKIGKKPDIDAFADYLAAFLKLRYRNKMVTIYAISFGFVVVTRMLQRHPALTKKVDLLVSAVGLMHTDDLAFSHKSKVSARALSRFIATRPVSFLGRYLFLNGYVLRHMYTKLPNSKRRMLEITAEEFDSSMELEVKLWQTNHVRTHWLTTNEMLKLNNCQKPIALPVVHIISKHEHYLNNISVEQHMRQVFLEYRQFTAQSKAHVPSVIADKKAMSVMVPPELRKMLAKKPGSDF